MNTITNHGAQRIAERTRSKADEARITKIWETGRKISDYTDRRMIKYLTGVQKKGGEDRVIRVSGNDVYIFSKAGVLITVLNIKNKKCQFNSKVKRSSFAMTAEPIDDDDKWAMYENY